MQLKICEKKLQIYAEICRQKYAKICQNMQRKKASNIQILYADKYMQEYVLICSQSNPFQNSMENDVYNSERPHRFRLDSLSA